MQLLVATIGPCQLHLLIISSTHTPFILRPLYLSWEVCTSHSCLLGAHTLLRCCCAAFLLNRCSPPPPQLPPVVLDLLFMYGGFGVPMVGRCALSEYLKADPIHRQTIINILLNKYILSFMICLYPFMSCLDRSTNLTEQLSLVDQYLTVSILVVLGLSTLSTTFCKLNRTVVLVCVCVCGCACVCV